MKQFGATWTQVFVVILIVLVLTCMGAPIVPLIFEFPAMLIFGWIGYLMRVTPAIRIDWANVVFAAALVAFFVVGAHGFLGWLWKNLRNEAWPLKRTIALTFAILFAFVAGISVTGIIHQIAWQVAGDEPFFESLSGTMRRRLIDSSNQRQIANGLHIYNEAGRAFPAGTTIDDEGRPLHGWQTMILPFIEEAALASQVDERLPWDDSRNEIAMRTRVRAFSPYARDNEIASDPRIAPPGYATTQYSANVHVLGGTIPMRFDDISDGPAQTILAGTIREECPAWGYPRNVRDPSLGFNTSPHGFAGDERGSVVVVTFVDGSVRKLSKKTDPAVLKAMATPRGGEVVKSEDLE